MADIVRWGLGLDANGALTTLEKVESQSDKTSHAVDALQSSVKRSDTVLRQLAESGTIVSDTQRRVYADIIRANGGFERYRQIQQQVAEEMRIADQVAQQHNATMEATAGTATRAGVSINSLRSPLATISSHLTNVNPSLSQFSSLLGSVALGTGPMIAVLAGLTALAAIYDRITRSSREAKEKIDEMTRSLAQQRDTAAAATEQGAKNILQQQKDVLKAAEDAQRLHQAQRSGQFGVQIAAGALVTTDAAEDARRVTEALKAVRQAYLGVVEAQNDVFRSGQAADQAMAQEQEAYAGIIKHIDDEEAARKKKYHEEEMTRIRERIALLKSIEAPDMSSTLANIAIHVAQNPVPDAIDRINGPQMGPEARAQADRDYIEGQRKLAIQNGETNRIMDEQRKKDSKLFSDHLGHLGQAAQVAAQSLTYFLVNKLGGGGIGGSIGAGVGGTLTAGMSAFGFSAGPLGAIVGAAIGGAIGHLAGSSSADREKIREARAAMQDLNATMEILRAKSQGADTALLEQIEANRRYYESIKKQINDALPGTKNEVERNRERAEADAMRAAEDARIREQFAETQRQAKESQQQELEIRRLRATGLDAEADAMQIAIANEKELADARKAGADAATLAQIQEVQQAEAQKRAADEAKKAADAAAEAQRKAGEEALALADKMAQLARAEAQLNSSLVARGLSALGDSRAAEDARQAASARAEMEQAVKDGMSPTTLAMLAFTQLLERWQVEAQRQIQDQTNAINSAAAAQIDGIDRQIAALQLISQVSERAVNDQIAALKLISDVDQKALSDQIDMAKRTSDVDQKAYQNQIDVLKHNSDLEQRAYQDQLDVSKQALSVAKDGVQEQQRTADETRRVFESLKAFGAGLSLDTSLTTLSPTARLEEARRQYEATLAAANGGDRTAAGQLPEIARVFLDASRQVNASGMGYVNDFRRVQDTLAAVTDRFGVQATTEERILAELQAQSDTLQQQVNTLQAAKDQARDDADAQIATLQSARDQARDAAQAQIETIQAARDAARAASDDQIRQLELARDAARAASDQQIAELQAAKDQARAVADAQISKMIEQVNAALQQKAQDSSFYSQYLENIRIERETSSQFYIDALAKLAGIIEQTFRTAENTKGFYGSGWEELRPPVATIDQNGVINRLSDVIVEQQATIVTLQAGFEKLSDRIGDQISATIDVKNVTKQGLESIQLSQ